MVVVYALIWTRPASDSGFVRVISRAATGWRATDVYQNGCVDSLLKETSGLAKPGAYGTTPPISDDAAKAAGCEANFG